MTVLAYKSPAQNSAEILSRRNRTVYLYSFEHHSNNTLWPFYFGENAKNIRVQPGITHGDGKDLDKKDKLNILFWQLIIINPFFVELLYLFNLPPSTGKLSSKDVSFAELFIDLWLNFGKSGNPTPIDQVDNRVKMWEPYNLNEETYYTINGTPASQSGYRKSWRPNGFQ